MNKCFGPRQWQLMCHEAVTHFPMKYQIQSWKNSLAATRVAIREGNLRELVEKQSGSDPINVLKDAFENIKPQIETKSRRVGGTNYQVPMEVPYRRSTTLAIRWLVGSSRKRGEKTMSERLGREILDASNKTGASVKKREDVHKMAESNRAFAHYRW